MNKTKFSSILDNNKFQRGKKGIKKGREKSFIRDRGQGSAMNIHQCAYASLKLLNFTTSLYVYVYSIYMYFTPSCSNQSSIIDYDRREARDTTRIKLRKREKICSSSTRFQSFNVV